jgi:CheY-like chemotaxis protein
MPRGQRMAVLRPGDKAPCSGVYQSSHCRHRAPHFVSVLKGEVFPACKRCGDQVRYRLHEKGNPSSLERGRPPSLLLVDPENTVSYTLQQVLVTSGYRVDTAASYRSAAAMLSRRAFDVVLTEVDLEHGAEGLQLALLAKQLEPPPVIILSASQPTEEGLRAALGVANYLVFKPIDLSELHNALDTMVSRRALQLSAD